MSITDSRAHQYWTHLRPERMYMYIYLNCTVFMRIVNIHSLALHITKDEKNLLYSAPIPGKLLQYRIFSPLVVDIVPRHISTDRSTMFRITDIYNIAIQIEHNGEASYRQAAEKVRNRQISELLTWMADEERRHRQWFEELQAEADIAPEHAELEEMGRSLLRDMVANQTFSLDQDQLNRTETLSEMLTQSKSFEDDTILFYEFLRGLLDDEQTVRELNAIIDEERLHAARLEELVSACA